MNNIAEAIQQFFSGAADSLTPFLTALSIIGVATMAIIQTFKDMFFVRSWFQRRELRHWLRDGADEARGNLATAFRAFNVENADPDRAFAQLVRLSVDDDPDALLNLSIEQMCGQMNSAVQLALDYPRRYPDLLLVAASNASAGDLVALANAAPSGAGTPPAADAPGGVSPVDARNRVVHQLQRAIDAFQIAASYRWKWSLQLASFGVSSALAIAAIAAWPSTKGSPSFLAILFTVVFAGFLAPVARDLTAVLQKFRG